MQKYIVRFGGDCNVVCDTIEVLSALIQTLLEEFVHWWSHIFATSEPFCGYEITFKPRSVLRVPGFYVESKLQGCVSACQWRDNGYFSFHWHHRITHLNVLSEACHSMICAGAIINIQWGLEYRTRSDFGWLMVIGFRMVFGFRMVSHFF